MNTRSTRNIDIAGIAVALALIAAFLVTGVLPTLSSREIGAERAARLESIHAETHAAIGNRDGAATQLQRTRSLVAELPTSVVRLADRNTRLATMVERIESAGLDAVTIRPGVTQTDQAFARTPIEMTLDGAFSHLVRYLHSVHQETDDLEVTGLRIEPTGAVGATRCTIHADWITLPD